MKGVLAKIACAALVVCASAFAQKGSLNLNTLANMSPGRLASFLSRSDTYGQLSKLEGELIYRRWPIPSRADKSIFFDPHVKADPIHVSGKDLIGSLLEKLSQTTKNIHATSSPKLSDMRLLRNGLCFLRIIYISIKHHYPIHDTLRSRFFAYMNSANMLDLLGKMNGSMDQNHATVYFELAATIYRFKLEINEEMFEAPHKYVDFQTMSWPVLGYAEPNVFHQIPEKHASVFSGDMKRVLDGWRLDHAESDFLSRAVASKNATELQKIIEVSTDLLFSIRARTQPTRDDCVRLASYSMRNPQFIPMLSRHLSVMESALGLSMKAYLSSPSSTRFSRALFQALAYTKVMYCLSDSAASKDIGLVGEPNVIVQSIPSNIFGALYRVLDKNPFFELAFKDENKASFWEAFQEVLEAYHLMFDSQYNPVVHGNKLQGRLYKSFFSVGYLPTQDPYWVSRSVTGIFNWTLQKSPDFSEMLAAFRVLREGFWEKRLDVLKPVLEFFLNSFVKKRNENTTQGLLDLCKVGPVVCRLVKNDYQVQSYLFGSQESLEPLGYVYSNSKTKGNYDLTIQGQCTLEQVNKYRVGLEKVFDIFSRLFAISVDVTAGEHQDIVLKLFEDYESYCNWAYQVGRFTQSDAKRTSGFYHAENSEAYGMNQTDVVLHEYVHHLFHRYLIPRKNEFGYRHRVHIWFEEGMAEYITAAAQAKNLKIVFCLFSKANDYWTVQRIIETEKPLDLSYSRAALFVTHLILDHTSSERSLFGDIRQWLKNADTEITYEMISGKLLGSEAKWSEFTGNFCTWSSR